MCSSDLIMMPGMDGYEFVRHVRESPATASIPVILLTAKDATQDKVRGLDTGADDYVTKPFKPEELKARVRAQLRVKALQDELKKNNALLLDTQQQLQTKVEELQRANAEISRQQQRIEEALGLAYKVQLELLPQSPPDLSGFDFRAKFIPAETIAGDFYDFIPLGDGRWGIVIGDVAGKGLAAALVMVLTKTLLRTEAARGLRPAQVLENLNGLLRRHHNAPDAVTLFYGVLDTNENSLSFCNAGHEYPMVVSRTGSQIKELGVGGPFLGIFPVVSYNEAKIYLDAGDRCLFYTDGVLHLTYRGTPIHTVESLRTICRTNRELTSATFMTKLFRGFDTGRSARSFEKDDTTVIMVDVVQGRPDDRLAELYVTNDVRNITEAREFSRSVLGGLNLTRESLFDMVYAIDEAILNAALHAYESGEQGGIHVSYTIPSAIDVVEIRVVDYGRGLTTETLFERRRALQENLLVERGRGLVMMEALVDDLVIRPGPDGVGTTVVLRKKLGA